MASLEDQLQLQLESPPQPCSEQSPHYIIARGCKVPASQDIACKIPFLDTLFSGRVPSQQDDDGHCIVDIDPLVLPAIFRYVKTGSCQYLLTALPSQVTDPTVVFTALDFLCVDLPLPDFDTVFNTIGRVDKHDYEECKGWGEAAREAAVQLLLGISNGTFAPSDPTSKQRLFDRVLFIVSHPRTFFRRLRRWAHQIGLQHIQGLTKRQVGCSSLDMHLQVALQRYLTLELS